MDNEPSALITYITEVDVNVPPTEPQQAQAVDGDAGTFSLTSSFRNTGGSAAAQGARLPLAVNMIALRESFLSEAPFVST